MKLKIKETSTNYTCTVVKIEHLFPIENADKIQKCNVLGNDIVVSKDLEINSTMLYFVAGTRLNAEYCKQNNLYSDNTLNVDIEKKGYLSKTGKISCVKLRNVISNGMLMPLDSLTCLGVDVSKLKAGDSFTDIGDVSICEKYEVPIKSNIHGKNNVLKIKVKLKDLLVQNQFKLHVDTAHFARNLHKFEPTDIIVGTRKFHGSSGISSHVLIRRKLSFIERLLKRFGINIPTTEYGYVYSSGKPKSGLPKGIFNGDKSTWSNTNQSYYNEDYWLKAFNKLKDKLEKGITLYYEIVGVGLQGTDYTYGFEHEMLVYKITQTNVDGITYEFNWQQIKDYCNKYNIKYVTEYFSKEFKHYSTNTLEILAQEYLNKSYSDCIIDEGICIRNERTNEIFKMKSPKFIKKESDDQDKDIPDIENDN